MEVVFARADQIFDVVSHHSALWVYLFVLVSMIIENLFPPYPGDMIVFVCGVYAAGGHCSWSMIYLLSVIGTMISTMMVYYLGYSKGREVFQSNRVKWLGVSKLAKVERWFDRWGEKLLLLSRWLSGARALLALFAGVGKVPASRMFIYSLISTLTWNFAVLFLALRLRQDWQKIDTIFRLYGALILVGFAVIGLLVVLRIFSRRKRSGI
jgi:membrane protein DedA with SNARE-associated domain